MTLEVSPPSQTETAPATETATERDGAATWHHTITGRSRSKAYVVRVRCSAGGNQWSKWSPKMTIGRGTEFPLVRALSLALSPSLSLSLCVCVRARAVTHLCCRNVPLRSLSLSLALALALALSLLSRGWVRMLSLQYSANYQRTRLADGIVAQREFWYNHNYFVAHSTRVAQTMTPAKMRHQVVNILCLPRQTKTLSAQDKLEDQTKQTCHPPPRPVYGAGLYGSPQRPLAVQPFVSG